MKSKNHILNIKLFYLLPICKRLKNKINKKNNNNKRSIRVEGVSLERVVINLYIRLYIFDAFRVTLI